MRSAFCGRKRIAIIPLGAKTRQPEIASALSEISHRSGGTVIAGSSSLPGALFGKPAGIMPVSVAPPGSPDTEPRLIQ